MYIAKTDSWYQERVAVLIAGIFVLSSVVLTLIHSQYWLILIAFVGANEVMFGLTGFCVTSHSICTWRKTAIEEIKDV